MLRQGLADSQELPSVCNVSSQAQTKRVWLLNLGVRTVVESAEDEAVISELSLNNKTDPFTVKQLFLRVKGKKWPSSFQPKYT